MKASEIVRTIMKNNNIRQVDMQEKLNMKSQSQVSSMLRSDMHISSLVRMLNVMGYIVVIEKSPDSIESDEDEDEYYVVTE